MLSTDSATTIKTKVESLLTAVDGTSPAGIGREIHFPATELTVNASMALSTMQSMRAVKGSTILKLDINTIPTTPGDYGMFELANDSTSKYGIRGNGVLENMDHIIGRVGAPGGAMRQLMGCKKHWANDPTATVFDWGMPGQIEFVPAWACDSADPRLRTHVRFDGVTNYPKIDYPFGYLAATINKGVGGVGTPGTHGTLDDSATYFTLPYIPNQHPDYGVAAMRVVP